SQEGKGFLMRLDDRQIVAEGFTGPHDPIWINDLLLVCNSHKHSIVLIDESGNRKEIPRKGFTRGVAHIDGRIYLGESVDRNKTKSIESSRLVFLDDQTFKEIGHSKIPFAEIFNIKVISYEMAETIVNNVQAFQVGDEAERRQWREPQLKMEASMMVGSSGNPGKSGLTNLLNFFMFMNK
ncbi:MAG: DUF4915 domain-containing protein, partial [Bacteroidetes bacterium]|nr:DUF4915 domain-containing protein [Bacteroidota bacterium]